MLPLDRLLAFAGLAFVLIVIPGPSVLFVISRALAYGRRAALMTVVGGAMGAFLLAVGVAVGMGAVIQTSAVMYHIVKLAGAAYLVYLGLRAIRYRKEMRAAFEAHVRPVSGRRTCWEGFVVALTNPKSAVFFAAVLPQFVNPAVGDPSLQMVALGAIFAAMALGLDAVWGVLAGAARAWFGRSPRRLSLMGGASGMTMIGLGVGLAFTAPND